MNALAAILAIVFIFAQLIPGVIPAEEGVVVTVTGAATVVVEDAAMVVML